MDTISAPIDAKRIVSEAVKPASGLSTLLFCLLIFTYLSAAFCSLKSTPVSSATY